MGKHKKRFQMLAEAIDLPVDLVTGSGQMILCGNGELSVECCRSVLLLEPNKIKLRLHHLTVTVEGENLSLTRFSASGCRITGHFIGIGFSNS